MRRALFITLIIGLFSINCFAAGNHQGKKDDWKQKMMSEKIAFLTTEVGITPEEGQVFWPVYNQLNLEKDEAMRQVFESYKALSKAIEENRSEKEIRSLLDNYLKATHLQRECDDKAAEKLMKTLPVEKVARLYLAEERFRRHQIHKLHEARNSR